MIFLLLGCWWCEIKFQSSASTDETSWSRGHVEDLWVHSCNMVCLGGLFCHRNTAGTPQEHCRNTAGTPQEQCRNTAGNTAGNTTIQAFWRNKATISLIFCNIQSCNSKFWAISFCLAVGIFIKLEEYRKGTSIRQAPVFSAP